PSSAARIGATMDPMDPPEGSIKTVSVLIVDDQQPFRDVARTVIGMSAGFEGVAEAASGEEAVAAVGGDPPGLGLVGLNRPGMSGIEATCEITASHPDVSIVLLSTYSEADLPSDARDCGAIAYVHKEDFGPALMRQLWDERSGKA